MNSLKKVSILFFFGIAVFISACNSESIYSNTASASIDEALTGKVGITETKITAIEGETSNNEIEETGRENTEEDALRVTYNPSDIEDTDDIRIARDCLIAYESCVCESKETADLGKYIDNQYLKAYLDESIKKHYENGHVSRWDLNIRTLEFKEANGINYITFNCYYEGYGNHRGASMVCGPQVGVRDGKVVAFSDLYFLTLYGNVWDSNITDDMAVHGYDLSQYPNPWDDEKTAKKAVEALKKFYNGEFDFYVDAWDSLGE